MPTRIAPAGYVYHVVNRAIAGLTLFETNEDYRAFERLLAKACKRVPMRILAYCLMPNHWHLVLWPRADGDLSRFMHWLCDTHARRWRAHRQTMGRGHVYQGAYKSFPVKDDEHLLWLCRYVERNAQRANLVLRAEHWRWCSLWRRMHSSVIDDVPMLSDWPVPRPADWIELVNQPQTESELEAIRTSMRRGSPLGPPAWRDLAAAQLDLAKTLRPRGRPPKFR